MRTQKSFLLSKLLTLQSAHLELLTQQLRLWMSPCSDTSRSAVGMTTFSAARRWNMTLQILLNASRSAVRLTASAR